MADSAKKWATLEWQHVATALGHAKKLEASLAKVEPLRTAPHEPASESAQAVYREVLRLRALTDELSERLRTTDLALLAIAGGLGRG